MDWKKNGHENDTPPEDFVLMRDDAAQNTEPVIEPEPEVFPEVSDETQVLPSEEINKVIEESSLPETSEVEADIEVKDSTSSGSSEESFFTRYKKFFVWGGIGVGAIVVIILLFTLLPSLLNPLHGYSQAQATKGNVVRSMDVSGTLTANAHYSITSLVYGKVTESVPEVGDKVTTSTVLYRLDDTEAKIAVERAENELSKSKAVGASSGSGGSKIFATESGVLQSISIKQGSTVSYGQVVATIKKPDNTVVAITSGVTGTVDAVSVKQGANVSIGAAIASVTDSSITSSQKTNAFDQKSNELDVQSAKNQLENYTIKSPVSGVVIEKNVKVGDNVSITNDDNPMMVILDTTSLKFSFQVDEQTVSSLQKGMKVLITSESLPGENFNGEISAVSAEGVADESGKVKFNVDVSIEEPGNLRSGMKVSGKVIIASASNVICVPQKALMEAEGGKALLLVKDNALTQSIAVTDKNLSKDGATDPTLSYPWIKVPSGSRLLAVQYGVSDGVTVEIKSGLIENATVLFLPDQQTPDLTVTPTATATPAKTTPATTEAGEGEQILSEEQAKQMVQDKVNQTTKTENAASGAANGNS